MITRAVRIFSRFERFWHWSQMALIATLAFTGFAIHGLHGLVAFDTAVYLHTGAALGLVVLWLFAIFWHLTTGTWRHYLPTTKGIWRIARYYAWGNLRGEPHPYRKAWRRKHNPLQALAYLALKLFLFPLIWVTGIAYLTYDLWAATGGGNGALTLVAVLHTAAAFAIVLFVMLHVYLLTVGGHFLGHVAPMVTGFEEVELTPVEAAYLEESEGGAIRREGG
ncbi:cytochrome b/b6 domain-containing protein [Thioalbus denitrificans]|uniref:Thiosulfate reductase cytochrome b subunit n=1 Tax=Thioalbus denitrificans TaxID=547122 RepID=A0A369CDF5_9GAMM|nr:cytochrome b/b6 domain-containing protein [Thioalbus denitrificans]RCX31165.1 thiosulfate reductase cytochrome b subunit [Thioalbus denitrificans]